MDTVGRGWGGAKAVCADTEGGGGGRGVFTRISLIDANAASGRQS